MLSQLKYLYKLDNCTASLIELNILVSIIRYLRVKSAYFTALQ